MATNPRGIKRAAPEGRDTAEEQRQRRMRRERVLAERVGEAVPAAVQEAVVELPEEMWMEIAGQLAQLGTVMPGDIGRAAQINTTFYRALTTAVRGKWLLVTSALDALLKAHDWIVRDEASVALIREAGEERRALLASPLRLFYLVEANRLAMEARANMWSVYRIEHKVLPHVTYKGRERTLEAILAPFRAQGVVSYEVLHEIFFGPYGATNLHGHGSSNATETNQLSSLLTVTRSFYRDWIVTDEASYLRCVAAADAPGQRGAPWFIPLALRQLEHALDGRLPPGFEVQIYETVRFNALSTTSLNLLTNILGKFWFMPDAPNHVPKSTLREALEQIRTTLAAFGGAQFFDVTPVIARYDQVYGHQ